MNYYTKRETQLPKIGEIRLANHNTPTDFTSSNFKILKLQSWARDCDMKVMFAFFWSKENPKK